jgi:hypothetical protein
MRLALPLLYSDSSTALSYTATTATAIEQCVQVTRAATSCSSIVTAAATAGATTTQTVQRAAFIYLNINNYHDPL